MTTSITPYTRLPQGLVQVNSTLAGGGSAIRTLSFGGYPTDQSGRAATLELLNQSTWYAGSNRHAVKLTTSARVEQFRAAPATDFGSYRYASLNELDSARAEEFDRVLAPRGITGRQVDGVAALGDSWRPSRNVQLQYGVRFDGNRIVSTPPLDSALEGALGVRNDRMPSRLYASPRLGGQWTYGALPQTLSLVGTARPPRALIQGGVGVFQNVETAQSLINPVLANTGLPSAAGALQCTLAPLFRQPDWRGDLTDPEEVPTHCADGSSGSVFATAAPNVTLYDPHYQQARVLRSNVAWSGPTLSNRFVVALSLQYQRGFDQPAAADINLDATSRFTLDDEAGRPVFAPADAIVPGTGVVALAASRRDPVFGRVSELRSSLQQETRLVSVSARPTFTSTLFNWALTYTWQQAREQFLGFSSAGAGDPGVRTWSPALLPRTHTVTATFFYNWWDLVCVSNGLFAVASGARFTFMTLGDVNGDGVASNDRAVRVRSRAYRRHRGGEWRGTHPGWGCDASARLSPGATRHGRGAGKLCRAVAGDGESQRQPQPAEGAVAGTHAGHAQHQQSPRAGGHPGAWTERHSRLGPIHLTQIRRSSWCEGSTLSRGRSSTMSMNASDRPGQHRPSFAGRRSLP